MRALVLSSFEGLVGKIEEELSSWYKVWMLLGKHWANEHYDWTS
jgi:hypothetical protein